MDELHRTQSLTELLGRINSLADLEAALGPLTPEEEARLKELDDPEYWAKHPLTVQETARIKRVRRNIMRRLAERGSGPLP